jgi:hypothetical protein
MRFLWLPISQQDEENRDRSLAAFTTNIAESDFRYTHIIDKLSERQPRLGLGNVTMPLVPIASEWALGPSALAPSNETRAEMSLDKYNQTVYSLSLFSAVPSREPRQRSDAI